MPTLNITLKRSFEEDGRFLFKFRQKQLRYYQELSEGDQRTNFSEEQKKKSRQKVCFEYEMSFYKDIYQAIVEKTKEKQRKNDLFDVVVSLTAFCLEPLVYEIRKGIDKIIVEFLASDNNKSSSFLKKFDSVNIDCFDSFCQSEVSMALKTDFFETINVRFNLPEPTLFDII